MSTGTQPAFDVRPRIDADLPALIDALTEQQPSSLYPHRWPHPKPLEEFIRRPSELAAWTATRDGAPVGHVAVNSVQEGADFADEWSAAHGCTVADLGCVSVLFLRTDTQGLGLGRRLLDTAVGYAREHHLRPCLDVVDAHGRAQHVYEMAGWTKVACGHMSWQTPEMQPGWAMVLL